MAGNPYYVKPFTPDLSPLLDGIGGLIKENREKKQAQAEQDEIMAAVNSNDPDKVAELMIKYPARAKDVQNAANMKKGVTDNIMIGAYRKASADPQNGGAYLLEAADEVRAKGRDPQTLMEDADLYMEDPEAAANNARVTYAGLDPKGYKALQEQQDGFIPDDNDPSSVREFKYLKKEFPNKKFSYDDYLNMKRKGWSVKTINNVPTLVSQSPDVKPIPLTTLEDEAESGAKKDVIKATRKAEAKAKTDARLSLQKNKLGFDKNMALIKGLRNHKGKSGAFGVVGQFPSYPGSDTSNFEAMLNQLKNTVFISNREVLKGGGAITDFEGTKAEEAELRVSSAQSVEEFDKALDEYEYWIERGYDNMKRAAKGDFSISEQPNDATNNAPQSAIDYLKNNPQAAEQFKAKYGYLP